MAFFKQTAHYGIRSGFLYYNLSPPFYQSRGHTGNRHQGRIQDFKLGGAHLKKLRRAEGGAKIVGVFRVKNHDFTPKNHIFSIAEGGAKIFEVFRVKNHDFTPKILIFSNFRVTDNLNT